MASFDLFVRNVLPNKKIKEELICAVDLSAAMSAHLAAAIAGNGGAKLVIADYSRDDHVTSLQAKLEEHLSQGKLVIMIDSHLFSLIGAKEENEKKLTGN